MSILNSHRDPRRAQHAALSTSRDSRGAPNSFPSRITHHASRILFLTLVGLSLAHSETLIDPMRPYSAAVATHSSQPVVAGVRVTAIMQTNGRRVAVVGDQVVKAGDRVGEIVIEEVLKDGVRYKRAGQIEYAYLPKQAVLVRHLTAREE